MNDGSSAMRGTYLAGPDTLKAPGQGRLLLLAGWLCSAGLAVHGVLAVTRAELLQLDAVGVVAAVLARDVVALFALHARQRDLGTNVGRLGHDRVPSFFNGFDFRRMSIAAHTPKLVAVAGLEPATQRL